MDARGFTLIELLVVLACLGLISVLATGALPKAGGEREVRAAATQARSALVRARARAILKGSPVAVEIDVRNRTLAVPGEARPLRLPERAVVHLWTGADQVVAAYTGRILFRPDGSATGGLLRLAAAEEGAGWDVSVNWLSGRVSMDAR